MQDLPFRIAADASRKLVSITFDTVFWDMDIADRFHSECLAAVTSLGCAPGEHLIRADLRNAVLQSREVYEKMQALAGEATARRIALVASAPLARMQTKRLQIRENIVMFADLTAADAWLFEEERRTA